MSIAPNGQKSPKVREDLNLLFASGATFIIKVLTDLDNEPHTFFYRHVGPYGPKEMTRGKTVRAAARRPSIAGDRPPRYGGVAFFLMFRSARACPSHAPRNCSSGSPDPERVRGDKHLALQVHRTLMSIDVWLLHDAKVLKDLNIYSTLISSSPQACRSLLRSSRTLKTGTIRFSIDM